jgi:hypothetical protein
MRLLTLIFPSNYPNFTADSIYTVNRILAASLQRGGRGVEVLAAGPAGMPPLGEGIPMFPLPMGESKFQVRFGFPWEELRALLADVRPDVILVNMPEQSASVAVLARDDLGLPCKIVTAVHYVPALCGPTRDEPIAYESSMDGCGHGRLLVLRLLEGVIASDLSVICSRFGARLLRDLAGRLLGREAAFPRVSVLPPPVDFDEVDECGDAPAADEARLVYNHRLYDDYGTPRIFDLLEETAAAAERPFTVLVTNPTGVRGAERARMNPSVDRNLARLRALPFVQVDHSPERTSYIRGLRSAWAGIAPFKPHALWSMSVMDVLAAGRPVLSFDIAAFREMGLGREFLARDEHAFRAVLARLLSARAAPGAEGRFRSIAQRYSGPRVAARFSQMLEAL